MSVSSKLNENMFVLRDVPCEAENLRSQLHHSWLKNELLMRRPEFLAKMHAGQSPERASFEEKLSPEGKFLQGIHDSRRLCEMMTDGFSPAQLVDNTPLAELPPNVRMLMKKTLHEAYLQESGLEKVGKRLQSAIDRLSRELEEFAKTWFRQPPAASGIITAAFQRVVARARKLQEILTRLPTGIVLP